MTAFQFTLSEAFTGLFFTANLLFCLAFVVRDMAYLRAITIIAALTTIPYFLFQPTPMWSPIFWQSMFVLINGYNLTVLLLRRRPVSFEPREEQLRRLVFSLMRHRDYRDLLNEGAWREVKRGDPIVNRGEFVDGLYVLSHGAADVVVDGEIKATLREGDFVGEMSFITGKSASADVKARDDVVLVFWTRDALEHFQYRYPEVRDLLQALLGRNMAEKLRRTHEIGAAA